jgi:predicted dehydrogenase
MSKIKVGIIGAGLAWERLHYPAYQELSNEYEISAVCDQKREVAEDWGKRLGLDLSMDVFTDYQQMLKRQDLQVIDIMVPIPDNHKVAEAAARSRKNIILEKPLGATYEQAMATRDLPYLYGIKMMIAENYRYSEEFNILRQLVQEKKAGEAIFFIYNDTSCFPCGMLKDTFSATEWRQHPNYRGGDILDAAIHNVAGIRHVFGGIENLQAFGLPQADDFSPYAVITVNFQFLSGVLGIFSYYPAGREVQKPSIGLRIFCTNGMIYLENTDCGLVNIFYNDGGHEMIGFKPGRGYYNELLNFYNALQGREPITVTPDMEIGDFRTIYAILQSISDQDIIKVDKTPEYAMV